ncbi:xanthine dehydrogenase molybdopterin binding subunit [Pluralibacter gergoviae]|uniref:Xanthine dehydrogenase molybdopterin binding subunit n=1 Tax=Pluralibacter gergoviae TaxID=61647 RepID=A0AAI9DL97_PLUGE|nr:xanthine dehydrogenase molybdopterin binding subunit [Pluralibacter gergoviae]EKV0917458.1 xanthine dehydrogenase molybdopterin binding subunit [Pluralibacter gergoviae]EKV9910761.1 xanthine dehydrogenase molybdopterin binding subunit [Pluralibacter gergoviae]EKW7275225.1 xanthine dehydrogenase molybdopterin binding subunit [Pluralibacter gergoviae]ELC3075431.1 xanthine dehydrogenase molybdopterin binding subunit [Pluralibacter gergoviae]ELD4297937.1 xanthine dehydrogenase molybdopterin bin
MSAKMEIPDEEALKTQFLQQLQGRAGRPRRHESADRHVSGAAEYIDDRAELAATLHLCPVLSDCAHGTIDAVDLTAALAEPGVVRIFSWRDVPGELDIGPLAPGDPLFAREKVEYHGQVVLMVAADTPEAARRGAQAVKIAITPLEAVLDVETALARESYVEQPHVQQRGDADGALARAAHRLQGQFHIGGQEHFYLEGQVAQAIPGEDGAMQIWSSTQHPTEVQKLVASVLDVSMSKVTVDVRRMGGGFGGKETQAAGIACHAALAARLTGRPAKLRLARRDDMRITGKRHPFFVRYDVGFSDEGLLQGVIIDLAANCGYSLDLSGSICDRAMFHADNAYYLGDARVTGYRCRTNIASNTAFRGFGGPQGMMAIEQIMDAIARYLGRDPLAVRRLNFYGGAGRDVTHYEQPVKQNLAQAITDRLADSACYAERRAEIARFNAASPVLKRGLALTPVKFGISFTATFLNQAGALILVYSDGTVQLNHGGTEMGQGLNTKVAQIVADVLQIPLADIQVTATTTGKVPNTSPTAASSGADLNGKAAEAAARTLKARLTAMLCQQCACDESDVVFHNGVVRAGERYFSFAQVANMAWLNQVPLSATGFYKVPGIHYDRAAGKGEPFYYFAWGAACSEVVIDTLTGEYRLLRTDILHDVGSSLNPALDIGQIEGGFLQGAGWLTSEELVWDDKGRLLSDGPMSYKIPAVGDMPEVFKVALLESTPNEAHTVYRSKAVGEPPFMLGISVWCALQDAVAAAGGYRRHPHLDAPATPERVLGGVMAVQEGEHEGR